MMHIIYVHNYQNAFQASTNQMTVMYDAIEYSLCILYMHIVIKMHSKRPLNKRHLCLMQLIIHDA